MNATEQPRSGTKPRARFVTVVWGQPYIDRFATLSLPSFLAAGNLPALAEATDLEIVICTRRSDGAIFEAHPAVQRLRRLCAVRFVDIDDLVTTGVYGVTLTLAYARAVIGCGQDMLRTHFVFMNADFVLADGSLRSLGRHILAGRAIVLGPSFRAVAEELESGLRAAVSSDGVLAVAPRELVALSLPYPHPTTLAKLRNQEFVHSTHPNQFFWQVDEHTLLGRYYLIFMLCLKPERVIESINGYCDYAFIPELCPSGDEVAMSDSDEFFMLELQSRNQELGMLRLGCQRQEQIAKALAEWTTAEHRRAATHDILVHAGEIPPSVASARAEARAFVDEMAARLHTPVPHDRHHYWIRGVEAWSLLRQVNGLRASPPELAAYPSQKRNRGRALGASGGHVYASAIRHFHLGSYWQFAYGVALRLFGHWPRVTPLHPSSADRRHLQRALAQALDKSRESVLLIRADPMGIDPLVKSGIAVEYFGLETLLKGELAARLAGKERPSQAFIYLERKDCRHTRRAVELCRAAMIPGATCHVFIYFGRTGGDLTNFSNEVVEYIEDILGASPGVVTCSFVGGTLKHVAHRCLSLTYRAASKGWKGVLVALPLLAIAMPLMLIANPYLRLTSPRRDFVSFCTSVWLRFDPQESASPSRELSAT